MSTSAQNLGSSMKGSSQNLAGGKQDDKKTVTTDQVPSDDEDDDPIEARQNKKYRQQMQATKVNSCNSFGLPWASTYRIDRVDTTRKKNYSSTR